MAFGLCGNWEAELARAEIAERFGENVLELLDDEVQNQAFPAAISVDVLGALRSALRDAAAPFGGGPGVGSNNWALGPRRTASGGAIIANDPHLELQLPSVWYENVLRAETGFEVRGFSIPGSPSIVLGHNGRVAWSFTNSCADVQDLYVEELSADGSAYHDTDDTWRPVERRRERIHVARSAPVDFDVRSTRRGPILSDVLSVAAPTPISLRWFGVGPSPVVDTTLAMARAADVEEFRDALRGWTAPSQNVVFADTAGNIAYQLAGSVPVRAGSDGSRPMRGSDPAGEWVGEVAFDDLPHSLNPGVDRIVTANDRITPEDYPHFISREWMNGYRAARIRTLVDAGHRHTASDQLGIQADVHSIVADELVPLVLRSNPQPSTGEGRALLRQLESWDRELGPGLPGARAWRAFHRALQLQVYGFLGDLASTYLGYSRTGVNGFWSLFGRTTPRIVAAIAAGDESLLALGRRVGPTAGGPAGWAPSHSWSELVGAALDRAGKELADSGSRARAAHRMRLQHPLGVVPVLRVVANARVFEVPGDPDTVWQQSGFENPGNPYAMVGPSHRHVIDLSDFDRSLAVLAGGQSGHPASPHYLDQLELWRSGGARRAPWTHAALEAVAQYHQVLQPV